MIYTSSWPCTSLIFRGTNMSPQFPIDAQRYLINLYISLLMYKDTWQIYTFPYWYVQILDTDIDLHLYRWYSEVPAISTHFSTDACIYSNNCVSLCKVLNDRMRNNYQPHAYFVCVHCNGLVSLCRITIDRFPKIFCLSLTFVVLIHNVCLFTKTTY